MKYLFKGLLGSLIWGWIISIPMSFVLAGIAWFLVAVIFQNTFSFLLVWKNIYLALIIFSFVTDILLRFIWRVVTGIRGMSAFKASFSDVLEAKIEHRKLITYWNWNWTPDEFRQTLENARSARFFGKVAENVFRGLFIR